MAKVKMLLNIVPNSSGAGEEQKILQKRIVKWLKYRNGTTVECTKEVYHSLGCLFTIIW